jgi:integrase
MATFRQRDSGYWQAIIRRKGHPDESRTFRTKADAEAWARDVESKIDRGVFVSASEAERTTFSDLAKAFQTDFAPMHYKTRQDNKEAWRFQLSRLDEFFGPYSVAAIDQKLVAKFRDARLKGTASRKAVGESTARKDIFMLSKVLGFAESERGITLPRGNPVEKIRKPSEGSGRDRRLSADEWKKLETQLKKSRSPFLWPAVQLAVETAMRQGELLALRWEHIDRVRGIAFLPETKNGEARAVPLSTRVLTVLNALPRDISGNVLPVERLTLYHAFIAACKRATLEDFTFHDLRHEALSRLAERGDFSILELAEVSGHKTLQMLKRYTHLNAERLAKKLG